MKTRVLVLVIIFLAPVSLFAEICTLQDSEITCLAKILPDINKDVRATVAQNLSQKNTGTSTALGNEGANTVNDFTPKVRLSTDSGSLNESDSMALSLELTNFLGLSSEEKGHTYKLKVRLGDSELYQPLKEALNSPTRALELEEQLGDADNLVIGFSYNIVNQKFGRNLQMSKALFSSIMNDAASTADKLQNKANKLGDDRLLLLNKILEATIEKKCAGLSDDQLDQCADGVEESISKEVPFASYPDPTLAASYLTAYENSVRAEFASMGGYLEQLKQLGFYDLADLVNNQPQLNFTVDSVVRDQLVGPDELKVMFSFERGFVNVNSFRRYQRHACADTTTCSLSSYLSPQRRAQLERGDRIAVSLEYSKTQDYDVNFADDNVTLNLDGQSKLIGNVSYGRYLAFSEAGAGKSRVEVGLSYEDVSSDPNRQDRGMGTATFSQLVSNGTVLSLSLVYANKPEFRGDVDKEISMNLGLNYKFASDQGF